MQKPRWESVLKLALLLAIFAMAGPELIPAIEFATLLELLGALLFVTAFSAALKMTIIDVARRTGVAFWSSWPVAIFRHSDRSTDKAGIATYLFRNSINQVALVVFLGIHVWLLAG